MWKWFFFLAIQGLCGSDYAIVFIHLGPSLPSYAPLAIEQARLFNPDCPIYLAAEPQALLQVTDPTVSLVNIESLAKSASHERFLETTGTTGFWRFVVERFFYLEELMSQYRLKNVFHLENDNMLYRDLSELLPIFEELYPKKIGATFDNDHRCIGGFLYLSELEPLSRFVEFAATRAAAQANDMVLLAEFRLQTGKKGIDHLPIIPPSYGAIFPLESASGLKGARLGDYSNGFDRFQSIFDAAALGQYLGGIDPIHTDCAPGFINESALFNPSFFTFSWERDQKNRQIPMVHFQEEKWPINSLHVHSKNLARFSSLNSDENPTMKKAPLPDKISFSPIQGPIDVVIVALEKHRIALELGIEGVETHFKNLGRIIVISPERYTLKGEWFDSKLFPFSKEELLNELFSKDPFEKRRYPFHPRNQLESLWEEFLKLYALRVIPGLSDTVLVIDPRVILRKEIDCVGKDGGPLFHAKGAPIVAHRKLGERLLPSFFSGDYHEIGPFALFQREVLEEFFAHIGEEPWRKICQQLDRSRLFESSLSTLSLYGNFALKRSREAKLRAFLWESIRSPHDYRNGSEAVYTISSSQ